MFTSFLLSGGSQGVRFYRWRLVHVVFKNVHHLSGNRDHGDMLCLLVMASHILKFVEIMNFTKWR